MSKIRLEDIQASAAEHGWKVLSDEYKNLDTQMTFECSEGHKVYAPWKKVRDKFECPSCKKEQGGRLHIDEVAPKPKEAFRVLALDQATHITGFSIFDGRSLTRYGVFETAQEDEILRYNAMKEWLTSMIESWRPDLVALEGIQFQQNLEGGHAMGVTTFEVLARLQGVMMITCYEAGVKFIICPTNTWRAHCGVKGRTRSDKKKSMQMIVKDLYGVNATNDESDAIGIGKYAAETRQVMPTTINWET